MCVCTRNEALVRERLTPGLWGPPGRGAGVRPVPTFRADSVWFAELGTTAGQVHIPLAHGVPDFMWRNEIAREASK